jgi:hypothetical protein
MPELPPPVPVLIQFEQQTQKTIESVVQAFLVQGLTENKQESADESLGDWSLVGIANYDQQSLVDALSRVDVRKQEYTIDEIMNNLNIYGESPVSENVVVDLNPVTGKVDIYLAQPPQPAEGY